MKKPLTSLLGLASVFVLVLGITPAGAGPAATKSDNISKVADLKIGAVSEIAFQGRWAYSVGDNGLTVIDRRKMKVVSRLTCDGEGFGSTEVEVVKPGWIAVSSWGRCGARSGAVFFVDVRNPRRPVIRGIIEGAWVHTMTAYPGKPIIYVSPNGLIGDLSGGVQQIIDATDPTKPVMTEFVSNGLGCHDVGFLIRKDLKLAACAAGSETQLWDVSDPLQPVTIARVPTPYVFFNHSATFSDDGKLLVVGDEAHGVNSCAGTPTRSLWFYDISNPQAPLLSGQHNISRGEPVSSYWATYDTWCTAHDYNFKPNTRLLATGWYSGGINVLDLSDPLQPKEISYYLSEDLKAWGAYWVDGLIWVSDWGTTEGGVEVFKISRSETS